MESDKLNVANLGDSGFMVLRYNTFSRTIKLVASSTEQQHCFNAPYQLAKIPKEMQNSKNVYNFWEDKPSQADAYEVEVQPGDIVLLATDGLFDNLFLKEILETVKAYCDEQNTKISQTENIFGFSHSFYDMDEEEAKELAVNLAKRAYFNSVSTSRLCPFGKRLNKLIRHSRHHLRQKGSSPVNFEKWQGGKQDDIGVVVAFIS